MPAPLTFTRIGEQENAVVMGTGTWVWVTVFNDDTCQVPVLRRPPHSPCLGGGIEK